MPRHISLGILLFALVAASCTGAQDVADGTDGRGSSLPPQSATTSPPATVATDRLPAPEFPDGLDWLNTSEPLRLEDLRGKVVLLDFWTYGCINCIHIIPDLKRLEAEYADELVVIGVHSAKFPNESATENIRQIILRYGIEHPVVNDPDFEVWRNWSANAWPTVFLVDPGGGVVGAHSGERVYDIVQPVLDQVVTEFDAAGAIDRSPLVFDLEADGLPTTILSFPGKVLALPGDDQLFVADSGNHRIVRIVPSTGDVTAVYGSGRAGYADGDALSAQFDSPQGMTLSPDAATLYVADTGNHAVRAVDLDTGEVSTVLGTGSQAPAYPPQPGRGRAVDLSSPWDLSFHEGQIYIAMAGSHQIWLFDPDTGDAQAVVGTGGESTLNGPGATAELAQPSGVVVGNDLLFVADSESSSIRFSSLATPDLITATLAGSDQSLFDFGDEDGFGTEARLQHPLGIEWDPATETVLFADTYNSKIKQVDPADGRVTTLFGSDQGWADGSSPQFFEPGGISLDDSTLYVADTNNHVIRTIDLDGGTTSTLVLRGIDQFTPPPDDANFGGTIVTLDPVATGAGPGSFVLDIDLPDGHKVNEQAPSSLIWQSTDDAVALGPDADRSLTGVTFPIEVEATFSEGESVVTADVTVIYCPVEAESLCFIEQIRFRVPVMAGVTSVSPRITLPYRIELPNL
jgi:thiol-disulfide isomerase/thioredoxin